MFDWRARFYKPWIILVAVWWVFLIIYLVCQHLVHLQRKCSFLFCFKWSKSMYSMFCGPIHPWEYWCWLGDLFHFTKASSVSACTRSKSFNQWKFAVGKQWSKDMQRHMQGRAFPLLSLELSVTHTSYSGLHGAFLFLDIFMSWSHKEVKIVIGFGGKNSWIVSLYFRAFMSNLGERNRSDSTLSVTNLKTTEDTDCFLYGCTLLLANDRVLELLAMEWMGPNENTVLQLGKIISTSWSEICYIKLTWTKQQI